MSDMNETVPVLGILLYHLSIGGMCWLFCSVLLFGNNAFIGGRWCRFWLMMVSALLGFVAVVLFRDTFLYTGVAQENPLSFWLCLLVGLMLLVVSLISLRDALEDDDQDCYHYTELNAMRYVKLLLEGTMGALRRRRQMPQAGDEVQYKHESANVFGIVEKNLGDGRVDLKLDDGNQVFGVLYKFLTLKRAEEPFRSAWTRSQFRQLFIRMAFVPPLIGFGLALVAVVVAMLLCYVLYRVAFLESIFRKVRLLAFIMVYFQDHGLDEQSCRVQAPFLKEAMDFGGLDHVEGGGLTATQVEAMLKISRPLLEQVGMVDGAELDDVWQKSIQNADEFNASHVELFLCSIAMLSKERMDQAQVLASTLLKLQHGEEITSAEFMYALDRAPKDGYISKQEVRQALALAQQVMTVMAPAQVSTLEKMVLLGFSEADRKPRDGQLSPQEVDLFLVKVSKALQVVNEMLPVILERMIAASEANSTGFSNTTLMLLDLNGDGNFSMNEAQQMSSLVGTVCPPPASQIVLRGFTVADTNKDGVVSGPELEMLAVQIDMALKAQGTVTDALSDPGSAAPLGLMKLLDRSGDGYLDIVEWHQLAVHMQIPAPLQPKVESALDLAFAESDHDNDAKLSMDELSHAQLALKEAIDNDPILGPVIRKSLEASAKSSVRRQLNGTEEEAPSSSSEEIMDSSVEQTTTALASSTGQFFMDGKEPNILDIVNPDQADGGVTRMLKPGMEFKGTFQRPRSNSFNSTGSDSSPLSFRIIVTAQNGIAQPGGSGGTSSTGPGIVEIIESSNSSSKTRRPIKITGLSAEMGLWRFETAAGDLVLEGTVSNKGLSGAVTVDGVPGGGFRCKLPRSGIPDLLASDTVGIIIPSVIGGIRLAVLVGTIITLSTAWKVVESHTVIREQMQTGRHEYLGGTHANTFKHASYASTSAFPGYFVGTSVVTWIISSSVAFLVTVAIVLPIVLLALPGTRPAVVEWMKVTLPLPVVVFAVRTFVLKKGLMDQFLVDNGELRHIILFPPIWFILVLINLIVSTALAIGRFVSCAVFALVSASRVDMTPFPEAFVPLDAAYSSFLSLTSLNQERCNPVRKAFISILNPQCHRTFGPPPLKQSKKQCRKTLVRNRFFLALTLRNNPELRELRSHRLRPQEVGWAERLMAKATSGKKLMEQRTKSIIDGVEDVTTQAASSGVRFVGEKAQSAAKGVEDAAMHIFNGNGNGQDAQMMTFDAQVQGKTHDLEEIAINIHEMMSREKKKEEDDHNHTQHNRTCESAVFEPRVRSESCFSDSSGFLVSVPDQEKTDCLRTLANGRDHRSSGDLCDADCDADNDYHCDDGDCYVRNENYHDQNYFVVPASCITCGSLKLKSGDCGAVKQDGAGME
eukprot:gnl/MRDRNA2_/MRDRNA2_119382_c0_seq1.p1 gnl/MRDRNA2_/MRDRNA2_119382_c0~~gnl/MRDRNA2_/MRDRNA2_119382_c0_seq1.p1  ORF type:complete len:1470 (-),score=288.70 gnl/MRDRNA2_/MRDRNA2_119382_c0_seq1:35-4162(-)